MPQLNRISSRNGDETPATHGPDVPPPFQIDAESAPKGVRVRPLGEIDLDTVDSIRRKIDDYVAAGCKRVVLDLRAVTFMDSTGVHLILETDAAARTSGWELLLIEGPASVQRTFELAGVRESLPFVEPRFLPNSHHPPRRD
jgi:anti-anti-sigma factor